MKFKLGQTINPHQANYLPVGTILHSLPNRTNIVLVLKNGSVWHCAKERIASIAFLSANYTIKYLPPQLLQVGDEISKKDVNNLPVGTVFTYFFSREWSVLVTTGGLFIASDDYDEEAEEDEEEIIHNWDIMHKSIETVKIKYLLEVGVIC